MRSQIRSLAIVPLLFVSTAAMAQPLRILCLGDSITQGGGGSPSYRDPLIRLLRGQNVNGANPTGKSYDVDFVGSMTTTYTSNPPNGNYPNSLNVEPRHEGHWGWRADQVLNGHAAPASGTGSGSITNWVGGYTADLVLMHLGTNDAIQNNGSDPNFAATTRAELSGIITALRADNPDVLVYLAKLVPTNNGTSNAAINALNGVIDALAAGKNNAAGTPYVFVVDLNSGFNASTMLRDGVHPNATGEAFMAVRWYDAIKPVLDVFATDLIPRTNWSLHYVDSQETVASNNAATRAYDGLPSTHWHTQWSQTTPGHPHEIQINLGATYSVRGFRYLPRQGSTPNGRVAAYEFYVSTDGSNWGSAVASGTFPNTTAEQEVLFSAKTGRFVRFRALSEVNGYPFTSVAELNVLQGTSGTPPTNQAPNGQITAPAGNVTINVGQSVSFSGSGSDPDGNTPLTYAWNFGTGSGIPNSSAQNPGSVQFNVPGTFTVALTVRDALGTADPSPATRTVTVNPAGSAPTLIPRNNWSVHYVSSEETVGADAGASRAFDGVSTTHWHTKWYQVSPIPSHPHEIQIDLGATYSVTGLRYLPRQGTTANGRVAAYEFYVSTDGSTWGTPVASGTFPNTTTEQQVMFAAKTGRFIRLRALSEVNGNPVTSVAEINVLQSGGTPPPPTLIPRGGWSLRYVDSQETVGANGAATRAFDGVPSTHWHTQWYQASPGHPHEIQIDLGATYAIRGLRYLPRQGTTSNGRVAAYEFYISTDGNTWGTAVITGTFPNTTAEQQALFPTKTGRYVRFRALSEVNGYVFTAVAELNFLQ